MKEARRDHLQGGVCWNVEDEVSFHTLAPAQGAALNVDGARVRAACGQRYKLCRPAMAVTTAYSLTATVACRFAAAATRAPAEWSNAMGVDGARVAVAGRDGAEADAVDEICMFASVAVWQMGERSVQLQHECDATPPTIVRPRSPTQNFAGVVQST